MSRLCARADVARSTFYLHFRLPDDVIYEGLRDAFMTEFPQIQGEQGALDPDSLLSKGKPLSYPFFAHVAQHEAPYKAVFSDERGAVVALRIRHEVEAISKAEHAALRAVSTQAVDADLTASYLAGALIASGAHWVLTETGKSAAEMAYWFSRMAAPGLLDLMGLSNLLTDQ